MDSEGFAAARRPAARGVAAFVGYVYGPRTAPTVLEDAPLLFDALAIDDPAFGTTDFPIAAAWRARLGPVEPHLYGAGGHGFGAGRPGHANNLLSDEFVAWLTMQGIVRASAGARRDPWRDVSAWMRNRGSAAANLQRAGCRPR